ncbi:uncharacterized protein TNCV_2735501 [Trichonephila clavipes]|nr:uncharacterized protein TNCV_2735501 [Trichonephila clavipes]
MRDKSRKETSSSKKSANSPDKISDSEVNGPLKYIGPIKVLFHIPHHTFTDQRTWCRFGRIRSEEMESSSCPNKIPESPISKMELKNENKIKEEENLDADEEKLKQPITIIKMIFDLKIYILFSKNIIWKCPSKHPLEILKVRVIPSI